MLRSNGADSCYHGETGPLTGVNVRANYRLPLTWIQITEKGYVKVGTDFFVVAMVAGILGFGGIAGELAGIAKILFLIFLVLSLVSFLNHRGRIR
jgi:uncharacterized membrane protein YtjA (UPF0391 family)